MALDVNKTVVFGLLANLLLDLEDFNFQYTASIQRPLLNELDFIESQNL